MQSESTAAEELFHTAIKELFRIHASTPCLKRHKLDSALRECFAAIEYSLYSKHAIKIPNGLLRRAQRARRRRGALAYSLSGVRGSSLDTRKLPRAIGQSRKPGSHRSS